MSLLFENHRNFLLQLDSRTDAFEYFLSVPMRMGGVYWAMSSWNVLFSENAAFTEKARDFVISFKNADGGFGVAPGHDSHITATHYAILILTQLGERSVNVSEISSYLCNLQLPDGSVQGDKWGEVDLRFAYDAVAICKLCNVEKFHVNKLMIWIMSCQNNDGGFAPVPGGESHAAYTYCAVAALEIGTWKYQTDKVAYWLCERQTIHGGFNGRPEKAPDVCYSWWVLASLVILKRSDWVDVEKLKTFILNSQDSQGGIADRPGYAPDVFHTFFGLAGLSLLEENSMLQRVDPVFAIPRRFL